MNKGVLFSILLVAGFLVAMAQLGFTATVGYFAIVLFIVGVVLLNLENIPTAKIFFTFGFLSGLVWLAVRGLPLSQVIALAGWALIAVAISLWGKNKVQSVTLLVLAIGILIFSQYLRIVILGK